MARRSERTRIRIALKGVGIAPELQLAPAEALTQGLDLGDVMRGESRETKFTVTNVRASAALAQPLPHTAVRPQTLQTQPVCYNQACL